MGSVLGKIGKYLWKVVKKYGAKAWNKLVSWVKKNWKTVAKWIAEWGLWEAIEYILEVILGF